ncbi:hypothetical protein HELRODRAFT_158632 [Helobdella robusta]|uniref:HTH CENPB-type domain-containing protein n=1 Tax=Helobdella robusta TaxID=6412 RepID=T1EN17_HELRO|nr:hypothetical protein HELRODRAFT_158632 [Helobdella robusta]ESO12169.1 hypothetical protein HELRODRAFT_158632 [Helobdella robusta]
MVKLKMYSYFHKFIIKSNSIVKRQTRHTPEFYVPTLKNEAAIRRSVTSGTNLSSKISSYSRGTLIEKTEKALVIWIEDLTQKRISLNGHLIKVKHLKFYKKLKESDDDFGEHDIEDLLVDKALNDDDILESMVDTTKDFETRDSEPEDVIPLDEKLLREGLQLFFIQNDNNVERALKFQRDLKFCMSGYRKLYKELVKPSQRLITEYLVKEKKSLKFLKKHYHVDLMTLFYLQVKKGSCTNPQTGSHIIKPDSK